MDKRFQVFISSTFRDLVPERQAVLGGILELGHMPAGMELFPAADDTSWELIKDVIDNSDYYVLIVGGRYGSLDKEGISYTEREYDYAIKTKKPILPLLHANPENLPREKTETSPEAWQKLSAFRQKVEGKHTCSYWTESGELKSGVVLAITAALRRHPAIGWVRADAVPADATVSEVLRLKEEISTLQRTLDTARTEAPSSAHHLAQGEDLWTVEYTFSARRPVGQFGEKDDPYQTELTVSWNKLFGAVAPSIISDAADGPLKRALRRALEELARRVLESQAKLKGATLHDFQFSEPDIDTALIQFRALGLIRVSDRARSIKDTTTYWSLTPYGDYLMTQIRALPRTPSPT